MDAKRLTKEDLVAALPDTSTPHRLEGLDATVEIYRDSYGIPHVKAQTAHDAFLGQGFATAQDRLWHMEQDRRTAYGTLAELVGKVAVDQDVKMRRFQLRRSVQADYEALNAETRAMLDAYSAGVNAWIGRAESQPAEYALVEAGPEPWIPWDCLAVFKARHILMGVYEGKLWRARLVNRFGAERTAQMYPGHGQGHLLIVPPGAEYGGDIGDALEHLAAGAEYNAGLASADSGSNNWVLDGSRTATGRPLLAGDPHRPLDTPNVYHQNHMACPDFDAMGLSFPGCPGFPHFGHNARVAWCVTHAQADYQDLYIERFNEASPPLYESEGRWEKAEVRHELIDVKGDTPVEMDVTVTRHGPVIVGEPGSGRAIAFKYTGTAGPNPTVQCLPRMLQASSVDEIDEAMRDWVDPCNNFLFADVHGDVGYLARGMLPIRPPANAWLPVPGWNGRYEWMGFVPFEELPRMRNPESGYIVTANNKIAAEDFPHYIGLHFAPDSRARRITERLLRLDKVTVEDMAAIHAEMVSIPARSYLRLLLQVRPLDDYSALALRRLREWDGSMDKKEVAPIIYSAFRTRLDLALLRHSLGPLTDEALTTTGRGAPVQVRLLRFHFMEAAERGDTSVLPPGGDWKTLAAGALSEGVAQLRERLGDAIESWEWGAVHFTRPQHPLSPLFPEAAPLLDPPSVPMGGDGDTPHQANFRLSDPFDVAELSVARYVFDTSDWDKSAWVIPLGSSGHPGSPHYADQTPIWADVKLIPMLYDWDMIAAEAESRQELTRG